MTLVQLRHFIALAASGSFSRSAEALFLTQPALSRSIRALEDELGHALFDRVGRRIELTAFGRATLEHARALVHGADELRASGQLMREGTAGQLRLGLGSGPGAMLMTPLLAHMARRHPRVRFELARGSSDHLLRALRARDLDALVLDARSMPPSPDLQVTTLGEMRGAFLCRRGHPLAGRRSVSFEALRAYPIASTPLSDEVARVLVERYGPQAHPQQCVTLRCDEIASLVAVARDSDAVVLAIQAAAPQLVELPMRPALNATARFGLVTRDGRSPSPVLPLVLPVIERLLRD